MNRKAPKTLYRLVPVEVELRYEYYPASRGARGEFGVPMEPDEPAEVEDIEVIDPTTGKGFPVTRCGVLGRMWLDDFYDEEGSPIDPEKVAEELLEEED
jgi:hypothetical protein